MYCMYCLQEEIVTDNSGTHFIEDASDIDAKKAQELKELGNNNDHYFSLLLTLCYTMYLVHRQEDHNT